MSTISRLPRTLSTPHKTKQSSNKIQAKQTYFSGNTDTVSFSTNPVKLNKNKHDSVHFCANEHQTFEEITNQEMATALEGINNANHNDTTKLEHIDRLIMVGQIDQNKAPIVINHLIDIINNNNHSDEIKKHAIQGLGDIVETDEKQKEPVRNHLNTIINNHHSNEIKKEVINLLEDMALSTDNTQAETRSIISSLNTIINNTTLNPNIRVSGIKSLETIVKDTENYHQEVINSIAPLKGSEHEEIRLSVASTFSAISKTDPRFSNVALSHVYEMLNRPNINNEEKNFITKKLIKIGINHPNLVGILRANPNLHEAFKNNLRLRLNNQALTESKSAMKDATRLVLIDKKILPDYLNDFINRLHSPGAERKKSYIISCLQSFGSKYLKDAPTIINSFEPLTENKNLLQLIINSVNKIAQTATDQVHLGRLNPEYSRRINSHATILFSTIEAVRIHL